MPALQREPVQHHPRAAQRKQPRVPRYPPHPGPLRPVHAADGHRHLAGDDSRHLVGPVRHPHVVPAAGRINRRLDVLRRHRPVRVRILVQARQRHIPISGKIRRRPGIVLIGLVRGDVAVVLVSRREGVAPVGRRRATAPPMHHFLLVVPAPRRDRAAPAIRKAQGDAILPFARVLLRHPPRNRPRRNPGIVLAALVLRHVAVAPRGRTVRAPRRLRRRRPAPPVIYRPAIVPSPHGLRADPVGKIHRHPVQPLARALVRDPPQNRPVRRRPHQTLARHVRHHVAVAAHRRFKAAQPPVQRRQAAAPPERQRVREIPPACRRRAPAPVRKLDRHPVHPRTRNLVHHPAGHPRIGRRPRVVLLRPVRLQVRVALAFRRERPHAMRGRQCPGPPIGQRHAVIPALRRLHRPAPPADRDRDPVHPRTRVLVDHPARHHRIRIRNVRKPVRQRLHLPRAVAHHHVHHPRPMRRRHRRDRVLIHHLDARRVHAPKSHRQRLVDFIPHHHRRLVRNVRPNPHPIPVYLIGLVRAAVVITLSQGKHLVRYDTRKRS